MKHDRVRTRAFALVDLVATTAVVAVALLLFQVAVGRARRDDNQIHCLNNLKSLGIAMHAYSAEDFHEHAVPILHMMRRAADNYWLYRTANWFAWGGVDGVAPFEGYLLNSDPETGYTAPGDIAPSYGEGRRPLNGYVPGLGVFHCPSDVGYPNDPLVDDWPIGTSLGPCFNLVGNSYRASLYCYIGNTGAFSMGPWGHRLSTIVNANKLVLVGDPLFSQMIAKDDIPHPMNGWHGQLWKDNVLFCDGSAELTSSAGLYGPEAAAIRQEIANQGDANVNLIARTKSWHFDTYPTPGAWIWGTCYKPPTMPCTGGNKTKWPYVNVQNNMD